MTPQQHVENKIFGILYFILKKTIISTTITVQTIQTYDHLQ